MSKGSNRRPAQVPGRVYDQNYDLIFKKSTMVDKHKEGVMTEEERKAEVDRINKAIIEGLKGAPPMKNPFGDIIDNMMKRAERQEVWNKKFSENVKKSQGV